MKEIVVDEYVCECPFCKSSALKRREELWFSTFRHREEKCVCCGYYRYM